MLLHVAVPGLLWPQDSIAQITRDLALPALHALLGRGRHARRSALPFEYWLCDVFGVKNENEEFPIGALRLLGDGGAPGNDVWLCADPSHLRFARDTLALDAAGPDLNAGEAAQLAAALNAHLSDVDDDFGELFAPHPRRWYLRVKRQPRIVTQPPSALAGRTLEPFLPRGEDARDWRRFINETQVLLHNHPVNAAREAAGRPTANSLWPWGAGVLPSVISAPAAHLHADHPLALGLARRAGMPASCVPARAGDAAPRSLIVLDTLDLAAQSLDATAWRAGAMELEARWFAPMLTALKAGRLRGLRLTALGDDGIVDIVLNRRDPWRFWRRPRALAGLRA
ncbi:MAG: hypothetical protein LBE33_01640 [Zoogloeaceae bacterium]|jgi:hypothetical protein|nr:hypothetical protein [Zoogloeaceae bacterium]